MSSEILGSAENVLKGNLGGAWDIKHGYADAYTDLGIARKFGGSVAAYSLRDIGAMNDKVIKVRREQDDEVADFSASAIESGGVEQFAIGQTVLDLYNNASYSNDLDNDFWGRNPSSDAQIDLGSGACSWSCDFIITTDTYGATTTRLCSSYDSSEHFYFSSATQFRWKNPSADNTTSINLDVTIQKNRKYNLEWIRDASDVVTIKIDGVLQSNSNTSDRNSGQIEIGRIGGFRLDGTAFNYNFNNGQHIYAGDGNTTSNWLDTGSGTTKNFLKFGFPVLFTGQGISAFVDTWYDQSGSGNNATQSATSQQPKIIEYGSIVKNVKGFPSIKFESANSTELDIGLLISNLNSVSAYVVTQKDTGDTNRVAGFTQGVSGNNSRFYMPFYTSGTTPNLGYHNSAAKISYGTTLTGTCNMFSAFSGDTNIEAFKNGTSTGTTALVDQAVTATDSKIGQLSNGFRFDGVMSEIFLTTQKLQDDASLINDEVTTYYNL